MNARDIQTRGVGYAECFYDLIQSHGSCIHDFGVVRRRRYDFLWHERPGVETDGAGSNQSLSTQGDQIGRTGTGTNEINSHDVLPPGDLSP